MHCQTVFAVRTSPLHFSTAGINIARIPARDKYTKNIMVLFSWIFFPKQELSGPSLFQSKKSDKPGMDGEQVDKLLILTNYRNNS